MRIKAFRSSNAGISYSEMGILFIIYGEMFVCIEVFS